MSEYYLSRSEQRRMEAMRKRDWKKTMTPLEWWTTPNPLLGGGVSPYDMVVTGKGDGTRLRQAEIPDELVLLMERYCEVRQKFVELGVIRGTKW